MRRRSAHSLRSWVVLVGLWLCAASSEAAEIRIKEECRPSSGIITLGDVADVIARDAAEAEALRATEICPAPPTGERRSLRARQIQDQLLLRGVNLRSCRFSGASQITLHGPAAAPRTQRREVSRPAKVKAAEPAPPATPIAVFAHALERGAIVTEADVRLDATTKAPGDGLGSLDDVVGRELTQSVASGQPVRRHHLRRPILVRRGEAVKVHAVSPGVRVSTEGKASEEGAEGDLIKIETATRETFLARVSGPQTVEVFVPGIQVSGGRRPVVLQEESMADVKSGEKLR